MNEMNICVSANSKYARYLHVMLLSLLENNRESSIRIFVLQRDFTIEDKTHLNELASRFGAKMEFLVINEEEFKVFPITAHFSMETYFRFKIPDLIPSYIDRILYIDVDVIIRDSIRELFEVNLDGYFFAACSDIVVERLAPTKRRQFKRYDDLRYFNAGVLMWNLKEIRGKLDVQDFVKAGNELNYDLPHVDQDLLNYLYYDKTLYLDPYIYNYLVVDQLFHGDSNSERAKILHYCWYNPWQPGPKTVDYKEWWSYARKTPFYVDFLKEELEASEELILKTHREKTVNAYADSLMFEITESMYDMKGHGDFARLFERDERNIIIYGAGYLGKKLYKLLDTDGVINRIVAVFDKSQKGQLVNKEINNDIEKMREYKNIIVIVTPSKDTERIIEDISGFVDNSVQIMTVLEFIMEASK